VAQKGLKEGLNLPLLVRSDSIGKIISKTDLPISGDQRRVIRHGSASWVSVVSAYRTESNM
jgi:hypothetical protein